MSSCSRAFSSSDPSGSSARTRMASLQHMTSPAPDNAAPSPTGKSDCEGADSTLQTTSLPQEGLQAACGGASSYHTTDCAFTTTTTETPVRSATLSSPSLSLPTPRNLSDPPNRLKSDSPIVAEILALPPDNIFHIIAVDHEYQAKADKWTPLFSHAVYETLIERCKGKQTGKGNSEPLFSCELMGYWDVVEGSGPGGKGGWEPYRRFDRLEAEAFKEKERTKFELSQGIMYVSLSLFMRWLTRKMELSFVDQLWTDYLAWEHANGIEDEARIRARLGRFPLSDFPTLLQRNQAEREALWEQAGEKR
ncbi:hypothetical protein JCM11641_000023 [Rhodosporidiobolus odoratus]